MPVRSKRQWRWLAVNRPDLLHKWQKEHAVSFRGLPMRRKQPKRRLLGLKSIRKH